MKNLLIILFTILLLSSCGKDEKAVNGTMNFSCFTQEKLSTGEYIERPFKAAMIQIWKADNCDFEIKSVIDASNGYAFDKITGKSIKSDYTELFLYTCSMQLPQGKYFIFVLTDEDDIPYFAYSYKKFSIYNGETLELKKVFSYSAISMAYDPW